MYIIGKLKVKGIEQESGSSSGTKRKRYSYSYDDRDMSKQTFCVLHDIGQKSLKSI